MSWYREKQKAEAAARRDELAEMVADGMTLKAAGERLGVGRARVGQMWKRICEDLGETPQ